MTCLLELSHLSAASVWFSSKNMLKWWGGGQRTGHKKCQVIMCHTKKRRTLSVLCTDKTTFHPSFSVLLTTSLYFSKYPILTASRMLVFAPGCGTLWRITTAMWCRWTGRHRTLAPYTCLPSTSPNTRYRRGKHGPMSCPMFITHSRYTFLKVKCTDR